MSTRTLSKELHDSGYRIVRYAKHVIWSNGVNTIPVPHSKTVSTGLYKAIMKRISL